MLSFFHMDDDKLEALDILSQSLIGDEDGPYDPDCIIDVLTFSSGKDEAREKLRSFASGQVNLINSDGGGFVVENSHVRQSAPGTPAWI